MSFASPEFWIALMQIIGVNIVLSGDNAVVIALAARGLPPEQQKRAVAWGSGAAVVMRIVLTIVAVELLRLPYLKLVGAALLLWIARPAADPRGRRARRRCTAATSMAAAIKTILLADLVMSLDNVIAVAAAAKGNTVLLVIGLAISIPLVVFASRLLLKLMDRFPIIITLGRRCSAGSPATWRSPIRSTSPGSISTPRSCIGARRWRARSPWSWSASGSPPARWPSAPPRCRRSRSCRRW